MARIYLSIGSNFNREKNIKSALQELKQQFGKCQLSSVYQNPAIDGKGGDYFNLVAGFDAELEVLELFTLFRAIEATLERDRSNPNQVSIDLDILLYDDCVGDFNGVALPCSDIVNHLHVIQPLAELIPSNLHPILNKTFEALFLGFEGRMTRVQLD